MQPTVESVDLVSRDEKVMVAARKEFYEKAALKEKNRHYQRVQFGHYMGEWNYI